MPSEHELPVRRSLTSRPQRLGVLPTYWFWNDREHQRLVMPLLLLVTLPVTPLLFLLMVKLQLSIWSVIVASSLYPYLVMGLVERHVRGQLHRRALESARKEPGRLPPGDKDM